MKVWSGLLLLCLLSVCRAAPLTCEQLTNEYHVQDLSGRWYLHAMSLDSCVISNLMHTLIKPSVAMDISLKETPKQYEITTRFKFLSFCVNETETYLYDDKASLTRHNQNVKLLSSSSTDSFVMKVDAVVKAIYLLSRKTTIDVADLRQFDTLATCVNVPRPQLLGSDYDFATCKDIDQTEPNEEELTVMKQRAETFVSELAKCFWNWIQSFTG